ncbi:type III pantothenate kinase [Raoultibacter phocaeensis]|uniref:type III pantothenate kinase n=1 Tax=Raoultibacter phocaeensis TaxID=2479841 RepID=UPI00111BA0CA|nr:type III pantothenate kinase [Raoultibacter phocaeensis]
MLLAIDVGNTQTVLGLYEGDKLLHMWRVATNKHHTSDELRIKVTPLFESEGIDAASVDGAVLASVVPALTEAWHAAMCAMLKQPPLVVDARKAGDLFRSKYAQPGEVGADRVADAVAARALFGSPCIVVDFGTATNIEVIDRDGYFIGGVIAPGIETSANALFSRATKLAAIDLVDPGTAIGGSTEEAIQAGIVYGEADRVDGLMRRIFKQLGYEGQVIATGGLARSVARLSETITEVVPELTLEGLRLIYDAQR